MLLIFISLYFILCPNEKETDSKIVPKKQKKTSPGEDQEPWRGRKLKLSGKRGRYWRQGRKREEVICKMC